MVIPAPTEKSPEGHFGALLGLTYVRADADGAVIEATPTSQHQNSFGHIHGGFLAALLDTTTGWAMMTQLPADVVAPHVQLNIQYLRPGVAEKLMRCHARVISAGRKVGVTEAVVEQAGRQIARANGTHVLLHPENPTVS